MAVKRNQVIQGDCIAWLNKQAEPLADLIFADPPFNIGYKYDVYEDVKAYDDYHQWTHDWMAGCKKILKPDGSFWVAIGDEYAAEVRLIGRQLGLTLRNWVIWHYTFGQQTVRKFARSHVHLFYFVNDPKEFTFNDKAVRTFSDRQRVYKDRRANKAGRLPNDTWNEFPRVCGTFGEREGWHPCQMPETILGRIVLACSNAGDVVFDPFSGSGTTLAVAKKFSREYLGTEFSEDYVANIRVRLDAVESLAAQVAAAPCLWTDYHTQELQSLYLSAAVSTEMLQDNPALLDGMTQLFNWRIQHAGAPSTYAPEQIWRRIEELRADARLGRIRVHADEPSGRSVRPLPGDATLFGNE